MKKIITQKELLEQGFEQFKYAGEYLFVGNAVIYIDKGDDDIIKFHDGKKYLRFIMSQRDITVFFKGDLDMIRISGKTEFDMKIVSERADFQTDGLMKLVKSILDVVKWIELEAEKTNKHLTDIESSLRLGFNSMRDRHREILNELKIVHSDSKLCCQNTNENLVKIQEEIAKIEIPTPDEPTPDEPTPDKPVVEVLGIATRRITSSGKLRREVSFRADRELDLDAHLYLRKDTLDQSVFYSNDEFLNLQELGMISVDTGISIKFRSHHVTGEYRGVFIVETVAGDSEDMYLFNLKLEGNGLNEGIVFNYTDTGFSADNPVHYHGLNSSF